MQILPLIRLAAAGALLVLGTLAIVPAPTSFLWKVAIGVTEWGHALAILCLVAAGLCVARRPTRPASRRLRADKSTGADAATSRGIHRVSADADASTGTHRVSADADASTGTHRVSADADARSSAHSPGVARSTSALLAAGLCLVAAGLAFTPLLRATAVARQLSDRCRAAFGTSVDGAPITPLALLRGLGATARPSTRLAYRGGDGTALALDFYRPDVTGRAPLVVVIHGGSWRGGSNTDFIAMDRYLADQGFAVADLLYRLAPGSPYPAACDDVRAAIAFARSRADSLGIDPDRIVLLGRSAGGQIALDVACTRGDPGICGVIAFYAPTDLAWSWDHPGTVIDTRGILTDYLGGSPAAQPARYAAASPVRHVTGHAPPTLLLHGGRDELVAHHHGEALAAGLAAAGVPHLLVSLPWATHGFDYVATGPGGLLAIYAIRSFLAAVAPAGPRGDARGER